MLRIWTHKISEKRLYCKKCRAITVHGILAKSALSSRCVLEPGIPLVCRCDNCGAFFVEFSHEIYFGNVREGDEYAKLLGENRLALNDWVYVEGRDAPGRVKALYTTQTEDIVVLNFGENREEKFSRHLMTRFNENAPFGFRLLPAQAGVSLIGDPVYHVIRKALGTVVGSVEDAGKEKLIVRFENGKVLFITLPDEKQFLPDAVLKNRLSEKILSLFSSAPKGFKWDVIHAVAYVSGSVERFPDKERILSAVRRMMEFRGVVDLLRVKPVGEAPDATIRLQVQEVLDEKNSPLFNASADVQEGTVVVNALYADEKALSQVKSRIGEIPGIRDLSFELSRGELPSEEMKTRAERLSEALSENRFFSKCRFRVVPLADEIVIRCCTMGLLSKKLLNLAFESVTKKEEVPVRLLLEDE